jgi:hypothetical protein
MQMLPVSSLGVMRVQVQYNDQCSYLNLYVVKHGGPALFGREWLKSIQLDWKMIKSLTIVSDESKCDMTLKDILARRDEVCFAFQACLTLARLLVSMQMLPVSLSRISVPRLV